MSRWRPALTPPVRSHCTRRTLRRREDEGSSSRPCCMAARSRSASTTSSEARARSVSGISVQAPAPRMSVLREAAGARLRRAESMSAADCSRCCGLCWRSHSRRRAPCVWILLYVRLSIRTAAPPLVASRPLVAGVVGGTLLEESGDALAVVCRLDGDILQRALQPQGGFQVALDGRVHQFFDEAIGAGRPLCQPLRQRLRGLLKLIQRHAFVDQPDAFGFRPAHFLGQHRQFQRLAQTNQARQEETATGIGDEADTGKGFIPDAGGGFFLPRLVGLGEALELAMLAEEVSGPEAERIGLVNKCVPLDQFEQATQALAQRLAKGPTRAYGLIKELMNSSIQSDLETTLRLEGALQDIAIETADHREGVAAFLQKRPANYTGH